MRTLARHEQHCVGGLFPHRLHGFDECWCSFQCVLPSDKTHHRSIADSIVCPYGSAITLLKTFRIDAGARDRDRLCAARFDEFALGASEHDRSITVAEHSRVNRIPGPLAFDVQDWNCDTRCAAQPTRRHSPERAAEMPVHSGDDIGPSAHQRREQPGTIRLPQRPTFLTEHPARQAITPTPTQQPLMRAIECFTFWIDANDANAIEYFARWQPGAALDEEIMCRCSVESEHRDVVSSLDETLRYPLQQSLGPPDERGITWRHVNDAERACAEACHCFDFSPRLPVVSATGRLFAPCPRSCVGFQRCGARCP